MVRKPPHCHCHVSYHPQTKNKNTQQNCWVLRPWSNVLDLQRKMKPDSTELAKETPKMHIQKSISLAIFHQKSNGTDFSRTLFNKMQSSYYILSFFRGLETVGPVGDFLAIWRKNNIFKSSQTRGGYYAAFTSFLIMIQIYALFFVRGG